jgi:hypothetical protein
MAWIRTLDEGEVTGALRQVYDADLARLGFVMAATKALSLRPGVAQTFDAFTAAVKGASALSPQERRLISLVVADRLGSTDCVLVYPSTWRGTWAGWSASGRCCATARGLGRGGERVWNAARVRRPSAGPHGRTGYLEGAGDGTPSPICQGRLATLSQSEEERVWPSRRASTV